MAKSARFPPLIPGKKKGVLQNTWCSTPLFSRTGVEPQKRHIDLPVGPCGRAGIGQRKSGGRSRLENKVSRSPCTGPIGRGGKIDPCFQVGRPIVAGSNLQIPRLAESGGNPVRNQVCPRLQRQNRSALLGNRSCAVLHAGEKVDGLARRKQRLIVVKKGGAVGWNFSRRPGDARGAGGPCHTGETRGAGGPLDPLRPCGAWHSGGSRWTRGTRNSLGACIPCWTRGPFRPLGACAACSTCGPSLPGRALGACVPLWPGSSRRAWGARATHRTGSSVIINAIHPSPPSIPFCY